MDARSRELVATDEPTVIAKLLLDTTVMENCQGDGSPATSTRTDESDRHEVVGEVDDLIDQLVTSETDSRRRGRQLSGRNARHGRKSVGSMAVGITDLVLV